MNDQSNQEIWKGVYNIPDEEIWNMRKCQVHVIILKEDDFTQEFRTAGYLHNLLDEPLPGSVVWMGFSCKDKLYGSTKATARRRDGPSPTRPPIRMNSTRTNWMRKQFISCWNIISCRYIMNGKKKTIRKQDGWEYSSRCQPQK